MQNLYLKHSRPMKRIRALALWSFRAVGIGLSGGAGLEAEVKRMLADMTPARVSQFYLGSVL